MRATKMTHSFHRIRALQRRDSYANSMAGFYPSLVFYICLHAWIDPTWETHAFKDSPKTCLMATPLVYSLIGLLLSFSYPISCARCHGPVLSKYYDPRIWIGCSAILWGLCSTLMSIADDFESLLIARLCLGVFEAAFVPSVVLYYSFYYTKAEQGTRIASWTGFAAVAGAFGGLIAYGIQHVETSIVNWRLLFTIEYFFGVLCLFILPGRPESADFLTHAERKLAIERMNRGTSGDIGAVIYIAGVVGFALNCALTSVSAFLPTIIETMGYSPALSQLMTVPPYAVAALILLTASYISDRVQSRGLMVASGCTLCGVGYIILLVVAHAHVHIRYLATFCIAAGAYTSLGLVFAWFAHNLGSESKRAAGLPLLNAISQVGSILGSHLYPLTEGPAYSRGFGVSGALMFLAAFLTLTLTTSYRWENARRNAAFGEPDHDALVDTSELADKAPGFRYLP
ncbi:major facilitator superfamily domain-containing protein [Boletus edulis]|nr:major facilitator superfamily domain-containing protein [Boletus edulis]